MTSKRAIDGSRGNADYGDIRRSNPSPAAMTAFAGGVGSAAIVAALIFARHQKARVPGRSD